MNRLFKVLLICSGMLCPLLVSGQSLHGAPGVRVYNYTSFTFEPKSVNRGWETLTPDSLKSHPEYGVIPYNAPCTECVEVLSERTASTRKFIKNNGEGNTFLSTASLIDLHYPDSTGVWLSYDPRLTPTVVPGVFESRRQPNTTVLNMQEGYSSIALIDGEQFILISHCVHIISMH